MRPRESRGAASAMRGAVCVRSRIGTAVRTGVQHVAEGQREFSTSDQERVFEDIAV